MKFTICKNVSPSLVTEFHLHHIPSYCPHVQREPKMTGFSLQVNVRRGRLSFLMILNELQHPRSDDSDAGPVSSSTVARGNTAGITGDARDHTENGVYKLGNTVFCTTTVYCTCWESIHTYTDQLHYIIQCRLIWTYKYTWLSSETKTQKSNTT